MQVLPSKQPTTPLPIEAPIPVSVSGYPSLSSRRSGRQPQSSSPFSGDSDLSSSPSSSITRVSTTMSSHHHIPIVPSSSDPSVSLTQVTAIGTLRSPSSSSSLASSSSSTSTSTITLTRSLSPSRIRTSKSMVMSGHGGMGYVSSGGHSGFLPFVPLTPIMASPRLTPDLGSTGASIQLRDDAEVEKFLREDYFNAGIGASSSSSRSITVLASSSASTVGVSSLSTSQTVPAWTSTPPTPPQKPAIATSYITGYGASDSEKVDDVESSERTRHAKRNRGAAGGRTRPRPASVAVFPQTSIETLRRGASEGSGVSYSNVASSHHHEQQRGRRIHGEEDFPERRPKRRQSLPPNFGKPLPPLPHQIHHYSSVTLPSPPLPPLPISTHSHSSSSTSSSHSHPPAHTHTLPPAYEHLSPSLSRSRRNSTRKQNTRTLPSTSKSPSAELLPPSLSRHPRGLRSATSPILPSSPSLTYSYSYTSSPSQIVTTSQKRGSPLRFESPSPSGSVCSSETSHSPSSESFRSALEDLSLGDGHDINGSPMSTHQAQRQSGGHSRKKSLFHLEVDDDEERDEDIEDQGMERLEKGRASINMEGHKTKRYHALMELLNTEVGYLLDLRVLVSIYLEQLPTLRVSLAPSLSRSSASAISIASLGLGRPFPSSWSSLSSHPQQSSNSLSSNLGPPTEASQSSSSSHESSEPSSYDSTSRSILTEKDIGLIRRNAEDIVALHESFVRELKNDLESMGYGEVFEKCGLPESWSDHVVGAIFNHMDRLDEAIDKVAGVFERQASVFKIYEDFCPKHNEAADLIRNVQYQYPVEWDAFEQRCSKSVARAFGSAAPSLEHYPPHPSKSKSADSPASSDHSPEHHRRQRRHSTSSASALPPIGLLPVTSSSHTLMTHTKSDPTNGEKRKQAQGQHYPQQQSTFVQSDVFISIPTSSSSQAGRLKFLDYLIKPVQRICKYPLLLAQLQTKLPTSSTTPHVNDALLAMKHVCSLVDLASEKQAHSVKSALIVKRIIHAVPVSYSALSSPSTPGSFIAGSGVSGSGTGGGGQGYEERQKNLSKEFLDSLGACLLSGALDVVHHHPSSQRCKYLGAFLYVGGYMVLVKVFKNGKVYEPKYWFSLVGFELLDTDDDDIIPYSFHICGQGHHLQLAASCQSEKEIWMAAVQEALSRPPSWTNEPVSSLLQMPEKAHGVSPTEEDQTHEWTTPLPTIQSLSDLENNADNVTPTASKIVPSKPFRTMSRFEGSTWRTDHANAASIAALSRRSSTASVKAFFTFEGSTPRLARASPQNRHSTEQGLADVFSENCLTVRSQAQMRDEELFHRRRPSPNITRSNSAMAITAMAALRGSRSVLYSSRRKPSLDSKVDDFMTSDNESNPRKKVKTVKPPRPKKHHSISSSEGHGGVPSLIGSNEAESENCHGGESRVESPTPMSQCSSATSSNINSVLPSPLDACIPLPMPSGSHRTLTQADIIIQPIPTEYRPKRTRSMIDGVKYFFHNTRSVSPSPSTSAQASPALSVAHLESEADSPGGIVSWLRRGSLRPRVQSSPEVPSDDSAPTTPGLSDDNRNYPPQGSPARQRLSLDQTRSPGLVPSSPRRVGFTDSSMPTRRRSLFRRDPKILSESNSASSATSSVSTRKAMKSVFRSSSYFPPSSEPSTPL
ncbi:hypothetical protein ABKN59_001356 [Abortiporus biennis]